MAAKSKQKLEKRLSNITVYFEEMMQDEDGRIPARVLEKAEGIVILRQFKAGLGIGAAGGGGVALARDKSGKWSAPAFLNTGEASWGLQIGAQKMDTVLVLMNEEGMKVLTDPKFKIGVDAAATAGPHDADAEAKIGAGVPIFVYGSARGLYAGATIEGGFLVPADEATSNYYEKEELTMLKVLFKKAVKPTEQGRELISLLNKWD